MQKLGLIAGGGTLPVEIAEHCQQAGRPFFIVRLKGFAGAEIARFPGADIGVAELGKCFKALKRAGCRAVTLVGNVDRPDFRNLAPDMRGLLALPAVIAAARKGDDALLRALMGEFEKEGFAVEGAHEVMGDLTLPAGPLGAVTPTEEQMIDVQQALHVAREIGRLDVGQGAVVCDGLVLAVEAQEGTDAMLGRVAHLSPAVRGAPDAPRGVLAKAPKPIQETRIDLPTIGLNTIRRAAEAGLAGIAGETGRLLVLDREAVIELADELGLFVIGVEPPDTP
ncbi:LpxI family protein [Phenylobacterium sp.]|uniref:UDP-2,3-diacylglucosamine diphosphatase n=1 Tax=Phenylobacterium sp. TaxID=1871053 RepID=UPI0027346EE7|nr:UDP-2,3-diacylglucosamine diphosphatase LpxI [Phenylobacterium sp.]MDP3856017.1 UDP-2,3-diacylglucosamine diphosphatase LpxI [Phenylobacterium sp.]